MKEVLSSMWNQDSRLLSLDLDQEREYTYSITSVRLHTLSLSSPFLSIGHSMHVLIYAQIWNSGVE